MAFGEFYRLLPFMNGSLCEAVIQRFTETENRREPISKLLRYHRTQSENEFGWSGHFRVILGDIVNRLDASVDANYTQILQDIDRKSQATLRLLITELSLRRHFLRTNEYPVTLENLSATDIRNWFADPFASNGEAFVYRRMNGGYSVYSRGIDCDDDGGRPPKSDEYGRSDWRGDGDLRLDLYFASENDTAEIANDPGSQWSQSKSTGRGSCPLPY
jgi:hypothetical protein